MPTIISSNLKRFQRQKELSIPKLAEQSGVSARTIERIRSGKHVPDLDTIKKLAKALGQKPEHLVEGAIKKQEISAGIALSINSKNIERVFKKAHKKLKALDLKLDKTHAKAIERAELPVGTIKDRKDFTKFERGFKPKELTGWAKDLVETMQRERKEWETRVEKAKRQVFLAVSLSTILLSIAFYFAL